MGTLARLLVLGTLLSALVIPAPTEARGKGTRPGTAAPKSFTAAQRYSKIHSNARIQSAFMLLDSGSTTARDFLEAYRIYRDLVESGDFSKILTSPSASHFRRNMIRFEQVERKALHEYTIRIKKQAKHIKLEGMPEFIERIIGARALNLPISRINFLPKSDTEFSQVFVKSRSSYDKRKLTEFFEAFPPQNNLGGKTLVSHIRGSAPQIHIVIGHNVGGKIKRPDGRVEDISEIAGACRAAGSYCIIISCHACKFTSREQFAIGTKGLVYLRDLRTRVESIVEFLEYAKKQASEGPAVQELHSQWLREVAHPEMRSEDVSKVQLLRLAKSDNLSVVELNWVRTTELATRSVCSYPKEFHYICVCWGFFIEEKRPNVGFSGCKLPSALDANRLPSRLTLPTLRLQLD